MARLRRQDPNLGNWGQTEPGEDARISGYFSGPRPRRDASLADETDLGHGVTSGAGPASQPACRPTPRPRRSLLLPTVCGGEPAGLHAPGPSGPRKAASAARRKADSGAACAAAATAAHTRTNGVPVRPPEQTSTNARPSRRQDESQGTNIPKCQALFWKKRPQTANIEKTVTSGRPATWGNPDGLPPKGRARAVQQRPLRSE